MGTNGQMEWLLNVVDLERTYHFNGHETPVLAGVDLQMPANHSIAVMGPSGSGKSTLLGILGGLDRPSSGRVELLGEEITRLSESHLTNIRNRLIGFIFQFFHLIPSLTVLENVILPARTGVGGVQEPEARARELLSQVGLADKWRHKPRQLSGGERQRVAIARALINEPRLILADEPTGNLDAKTGGMITDLLWEVHRRSGAGLICATHDVNVARRADQIFELNNGRLVTAG